MSEVWNASALLFLLLNPFSMSIYLSALIEDLDRRTFRRVLMRGTLIATSTFILFAWVGAPSSPTFCRRASQHS